MDRCHHEQFLRTRARYYQPCGCNYSAQKADWQSILEYQSYAAIKEDPVGLVQNFEPPDEIIPKRTTIPPSDLKEIPPNVVADVIETVTLRDAIHSGKKTVSKVSKVITLREAIEHGKKSLAEAAAIGDSLENSKKSLSEKTVEVAGKEIAVVPVNVPYEAEHGLVEDAQWLWTAAAIVAIGFSAYLYCNKPQHQSLRDGDLKTFHHQKRSKKSKKRQSKLVLATRRKYSSD